MKQVVGEDAAAAKARRWLGVRLGITGAVVTGLFGLIAHKAWSVQIGQGDRLKALGEAQYLHDLELPAPRGTITDRQGVPLAVSVDVQSIYVRPRDLADARAAAMDLARILKLDHATLLARFTAGKPFVWVKRRVTPDEAKAVAALHLPGVAMTPEPKRFYPAGNLAGPVLGAAGIDGHGVDGLEKSLDVHLLGDLEKHQVLRDARGHVLYDGGWTEDAASTPAGDTVTLTIDRYVQYVAEQALAEGVREHQAKSGVVVVLDVQTGEVLAMASSPTFDPNATEGRDGARNRPVTDTFEPGSGMKVFTVATALEAGAIDANDSWSVDGGRIVIGGKHTTRDAHFWKPILTTGEVIKISSNVGAVKIARKTGKEALAAGLRRFGFGVPTGVELPGERAGKVRDTKRWGEAGLATIAFGYGLMVTPLQMAAALASIASGGMYHAPRIVKDVRAPDGHVVFQPEVEARRVISEQHAREVMRMLEMVMEEEGTGQKIKAPGFRLAGKTGTAYKIDPATHRYSTNHYLSSFIGVAPSDHPRIAIVVMIDDPSGKYHYGGEVAGPVFADIVSGVLPYLGVAADPVLVAEEAAKAAKKGKSPAVVAEASPPEAAADDGDEPDAPSELVFDDDAADGVPPAGPGEDIVVIPDFRGMSTSQAVAAAQAAGVKLTMTGSGRVVSQFPPPGRAMKSITCQVTFEPR